VGSSSGKRRRGLPLPLPLPTGCFESLDAAVSYDGGGPAGSNDADCELPEDTIWTLRGPLPKTVL